jgi:dipeptidyl aminopeptidase/acylaminoacyl peptidase
MGDLSAEFRSQEEVAPLLIHGGPHAAHIDVWHYRWNTQVFAAHGYVVVGVNYHGSSGFVQQWMETITADYGRREFADTEAATDFMLRRGYIDRNRLVATGGSYGGYMVAYMNGHTDRYRTFVTTPVASISMMATDGWAFRQELGVPLGQSARVMQRRRIISRNFSRRRPVIHGELDYRVPATQAAVLQHAACQADSDAPGCFPDEPQD